MKHPLSAFFQRAFYWLPAAFLLCSCVDSTVDYDSKEVDSKVKFNLDGFKFKFGDTEVIKLVDILKPERNIKNDANGVYYLVEKGQTHLDFSIEKASSEVNANRMNISANFGDHIWAEVNKQMNDAQRALLATTGYTVPANANPDYVPFEDSENFDFNFTWNKEMKSVKSVGLENATFHFKLKLQDDVAKNFAIYGYKKLQLRLPSYIKSNSPNFKDGVFTFTDRKIAEGLREIDLGTISIDQLAFSPALTNNKMPREKFHLKGEIAMGVKTPFHVSGNTAPKATIALLVNINGKNKDVIKAKTITGVFNPTIAPNIDPIYVKKQVPDFLTGNDVALKVAQLTLRLDADMKEIPATVVLKNGKLLAESKGKNTQISIAPEGVRLEKNKLNTVYFYQGEQLYDDEALAKDAQKSEVKNLNTIIEKIPDVIKFNLGDKAMQLGEEETTLELGKNYHVQASYKFLVPFAFSQGFRVDYSKKTDDINIDLKEITSDVLSVTLLAEAHTNIPLSLKAKLQPLDKNDNVIKDIETLEVLIKGSPDGSVRVTPITLTLKTNDKKSIELVKRFKLSLTASAEEVQKVQTLRSDQYIQIKNARIHLGGSITSNFKSL